MRFGIIPSLMLVAACGAAPESVDPASVLDVYAEGIDVEVEVRTQLESLTASGWHVTRRIENATYVAYQAEHAEGASLVRVVTRRGTVLALDGHLDAPFARVALRPVADPAPSEIVVETRRHGESRDCFALHWADGRGDVVAVPLDVPSIPDACLERIEDIDEDGVMDALVVERLSNLEGAIVQPFVFVPVFPASNGSMHIEHNARSERIFRALAGHVQQESQDAASLERVQVRSAIELARYAHHQGQGAEAVMSAFDAALRSMQRESESLSSLARTYVASWPSAQ